MPNTKSSPSLPPSGGIIKGTADYFRLVLRLMGDSRVSIFLKLLPVGALVYLINPIDIPGPFDDAGVIALALYMFVEMCPPEIVDEHRQAIQRVVETTWRDADPPKPDDANVVDGEFREEK